MNLFLYSTLGTDWDLDIVPHWINHYLRLGISARQFRLVIHSRDDHANLQEARTLLAQFDIAPQFEWIGEFSSDENYKVRKRVWSECCLGPDDWFLIADSDEFHNYDRPLREFYGRMNRSNHNAVEARMIDRVSTDGSLAAITAKIPLTEQFPRQTDITESLLKMNPKKIIAHKRNTFSGQIYRANHGISPEYQSATNTYQGGCHVAHYKWTAGVIERLKRRVRYYYDIGRTTDARKSEDFLETVRGLGKLPLSTPTLVSPIPSG